MPRSRHLVVQHLEQIDRATLEDHEDLIRDFIHGQHGIYALYRGDDLYYVGLASSLRHRLKAHLRDRHRDSWDTFSSYLTRHSDHMRELESLVLRIVQPDGNKQLGKLPRSRNLRQDLRRAIRERHREEVDRLVARRIRRRNSDASAGPTARRGGSRPVARGSRTAAEPTPTLSRYTPGRFWIRGAIDGDRVRARVLANCWIRLDGYDYASPTDAARAATGRDRINGWRFWEYRNGAGEWVPLKHVKG